MNFLIESKGEAREYVAGESITKYCAVYENGNRVFRYTGGRREIVGVAIENADEGEKILVAQNGFRFVEDFDNDIYYIDEDGENNFGVEPKTNVFWLFRRIFGNVFEVQIGGGLND